ncbi:allantoinase AllB [Evansella sp. AB-rgal1]|uniref:allantoinase AllB n=1 Tax=Evansella sp. AB-rgal1 TaxID=3242696 RepID=UPI00359E3F91
MNQLLIKNGQVFWKGSFTEMDIIVNDGLIKELMFSNRREPLKDTFFHKVIDAKESFIVPGFIDSHVHFNDPGRDNWEGFETGSQAAAAGGITTVFDMPLNSSPSVVTSSILAGKKKHIRTRSTIDFGLWGGITSHNVHNETELKAMKQMGIVGFKAFLSESGISDFPYLRKKELKEAMEITNKLDSILALHAEDNVSIIKNTSKLLSNRRNDRRAFLESRPLECEELAVRTALELVGETGASVHFVHVSSPKAIEEIHEAKQRGMDVTAEICPHYLLFDEEDFVRIGPMLKCAPPIRKNETVDKLWECVKAGTIDTVGSDHSPCLNSMKTVGDKNIWEAWGGIQGVQFGFPFFIDESLKRGIPLERILPFFTSNVSKRFHLGGRKGIIDAGYDADFTIINPNSGTKVSKSSILSKNKFTPYENMTMNIAVETTIVRGEVVYGKEQILGKPGDGKEIISSLKIR